MSLKRALTTSAVMGFALAIAALAQSSQRSAATQQSSATIFPTLPPGPMMEKATTACTECHEARIILQQRLSKTVWTKEVEKMIKWGAVVDASDRDALIDYLSSNFSPEVPPYVPPRSARGKQTGKKTGTSR